MGNNLYFSLLRSIVHLDPIQLKCAQEHRRRQLRHDQWWMDKPK